MEKTRRATWRTFVLFGVMLALAGSMLSILYLYTIEFMPSAYFCAAVTGLFAYTLGMAIQKTVDRYDPTDSFSLLIVALMALLLVAYVKWNCFFGFQYAKFEVLLGGLRYDYEKDFLRTVKMMASCVLEPKYFLDDLQFFNRIGTWGIKGLAQNGGAYVRGGWLTVVWVLELLALVAFPVCYALRKVKRG